MHPNGRGGVHDGWRRPPIDQFTNTQRLLIRTCVACPIVTICDPAISVLFGGLLRTSDPINYLLARPAGTKGMSFARREGTGAAVAQPGPVLACDSVNRALALPCDLVARPYKPDRDKKHECAKEQFPDHGDGCDSVVAE
jgi:hypothetical protein